MAKSIIQHKNPKEKYHVPSKNVQALMNVQQQIVQKRQRMMWIG
jgi:hypothetical protein